MSVPSIIDRIGVDIETSLQKETVENIFKATGYDWNVEQRNVYQKDSTNNLHIIPNIVANYKENTNTMLGIVSKKDYKVVQNVEAFNFINYLPDFTFNKIGNSNNETKIFVVGKSNERIYIDGKDDPIDFYITFIHGHDGKSGIRFILSPIRMACTNQMNMMLRTANHKFTIAHTGDIHSKLNSVRNAIEQSHSYTKELSNEIQHLISIKIDDNAVDRIINTILPLDVESASKRAITTVSAQRETIRTLYDTKDDISNYRHTAFGVISAISDYMSHRKPLRNTSGFYENEYIRNIDKLNLIEHARELIAA